jgi:lycopene cyclase domain-containing protein
MSLYGWVLLGTIIGPLSLSFDKKVHFYTYFFKLFLSILPISSIFLIWDAYFTANGIWGFTPKYLAGIYLYNLPIEEVLFFFLVPFACVFIYKVVLAYFPSLQLTALSKWFTYILISGGIILIYLGWGNWYTMSACSIATILIIYTNLILKKKWFPYFSLAFIIALIPFLIVNGILTGALTNEPIVWYSENHIVGLRIITIPIEDIYYNLSLLLPIVWIFETLLEKTTKN